LLWAVSFHVLFFFSWPNYDVFPYITYKTKDSTKTMEIVSVKALSTLFWWILYKCWRYMIWVKNRQHPLWWTFGPSFVMVSSGTF
jgi:hypothetical protein